MAQPSARQAELRALRASDERYRAILQAIPEGIVLSDMQRRVTMANRAALEMFGYEDEPGFREAGGLFAHLMRAGEAERVTALSERALRSGRPEAEALEVSRRDGSELTIELTLAITRGADHEPTGIVCVCRNITAQQAMIAERVQLEAQTHQAQRLESLGVLAGGIAHDFNNLLVGVLGNASLALMDLPPEAPARVAVQQVALAAQRAAALTNQMLAYSGRATFARERVNIGSVVFEMGQLLEAVIPKQIRPVYDCAPGLPCVEGDSSQVQQVITNLITNAAEAMDGLHGEIRVTVTAVEGSGVLLDELVIGEPLGAGPYVCLSVADQGCGIDPQTRDRMFEPFFTTKFTGRGLGLAAVLGIVRGHRGTLTVKSAVGEGSRFRVLIPAAMEVPRVAAPPSPEPAQIVAGASHLVVLIADDEEVVRTLAARALERAGFTTHVARDGCEAVAIVKEHGRELAAVVLDLTMPNLGGAEACRQIRALQPFLPVLLSSGYSAAEAMERFADLGLSGFVQKPYLPQDLVQKVRDSARKDS